MPIARRTLLKTAAGSALAGAAAALQGAPARSALISHDEDDGRFVQANGIRLHYRIKGSGPVVILLHGWPETSRAWASTMERLADRFTLIAPDLRGIGLSERPTTGYDKRTIAKDVAGLIEAVAGGRAAVVGHDMGGKAAYMLALLAPDRVGKLVLVDCAVPGTENGDALHGGAWHYGFHMAPDIPEMLTQGREREYIAAQIRTWSHVKGAIGEDAISAYARDYATPGGMEAGFNLYRALPDDAAAAAVLKTRRFEMPVMTIAGRRSVADRLGDAVRPQAPGLVSHVVDDCGHFVAEERPDVFCDLLGAFLAA